MKPRKLFIAGASGATGKVLAHQAHAQGVPFVAHYRPKSTPPPELSVHTVQFDLTDATKLREAMQGCTTVLQLIGTMKKRFAQGDTYESSDIGTTQLLADAARATGVDHIVLLSSIGAGSPRGAYLRAKAKAEAIARGSGIPTTILRPSVLVGEGRTPPAGMTGLTRLLGLRQYEPIRLETLSQALLNVAKARAPLDRVLDGAALFESGGATSP